MDSSFSVCFFSKTIYQLSILFIKPNCTLNPIFFNPLSLLSLPPPTNTISYKQMIWTLWILHSYHLSQFLTKFHQRTNYFVLKNLFYLKPRHIPSLLPLKHHFTLNICMDFLHSLFSFLKKRFYQVSSTDQLFNVCNPGIPALILDRETNLRAYYMFNLVKF